MWLSLTPTLKRRHTYLLKTLHKSHLQNLNHGVCEFKARVVGFICRWVQQQQQQLLLVIKLCCYDGVLTWCLRAGGGVWGVCVPLFLKGVGFLSFNIFILIFSFILYVVFFFHSFYFFNYPFVFIKSGWVIAEVLMYIIFLLLLLALFFQQVLFLWLEFAGVCDFSFFLLLLLVFLDDSNVYMCGCSYI